jgi:alkyl sulfatase BDS1-like metallo-beta-lactamase superfamily hydrolase
MSIVDQCLKITYNFNDTYVMPKTIRNKHVIYSIKLTPIMSLYELRRQGEVIILTTIVKFFDNFKHWFTVDHLSTVVLTTFHIGLR